MLVHHLKLTFKNLWRNKLVAGINLLGLALGFAVCILICLLVINEQQFDRQHEKYSRIYRVNTTSRYEGAAESTGAYSSFPMGPFLASVFEKEVENYVRLCPIDQNFVLKYKDQPTTISQVFAVDSSFFQVFDFPFLAGSAKTALNAPNEVVLSKATAERIFGHTDVLGKELVKTYANPYNQNADTSETYVVSGVLQAIPEQSHLQFDMLFHHKKLPYWTIWSPNMQDNWHAQAAITYVTLRSEKTNAASIEKRIPAALKGRMSQSESIALSLQPLSGIHTQSGHMQDGGASNYAPFDEQYLYIFGIIGLFILFIACINYANLSTIIAGKRGQEIAVRKAIGASRGSIIQQFLSESVMMSCLALVLALSLVFLLRPFLSRVEYPTQAVKYLLNPNLGLGIVAVMITLGILAGSYPAFVVSRFLPVKILRSGSTSFSLKRNFLIPALVVGQFTAAIVLVIGAVMTSRQLNYVLKSDMGYATEQVLVSDLGMTNIFKSGPLKAELEKIPGIQAVTLSDQTFGNGLIQNGIDFIAKKGGQAEHLAIPRMAADEDFAQFYQMKLVAGRNLSPESPSKGNEYLVNESLVKKMGMTPEQAIGQPIKFSEMQDFGRIVGVLKDFHYQSLRYQIEPMCLRASNWTTSVNIKVEANQVSTVLGAIGKKWQNIIPDKPFDYQFMDDRFAQVYAAEERLSRLSRWGSGLAIFIACLGLFGLAAYAVERRTKEIGIRKVLGASVASVVALLARQFVVLVIVATVLAAPIAWYFLDNWLQNFNYHVSIPWWIFPTCGLGALALAYVTVGVHSVKAALANPVRALKNE